MCGLAIRLDERRKTLKELEDIINKAEVCGGKVKRDRTTIPAMGWYALIFDPDGNTIGLYQKN